jgi:hypothetical protein
MTQQLSAQMPDKCRSLASYRRAVLNRSESYHEQRAHDVVNTPVVRNGNIGYCANLLGNLVWRLASDKNQDKFDARRCECRSLSTIVSQNSFKRIRGHILTQDSSGFAIC